MFLRLFRQGSDGDAAHHDRNFFGAIKIGDFVRLVKLRGERADGDEIEIRRQFGQFFEVGDFVILHVKFLRRQPGEREQAEAGQRGDDFVAVHEAGQREAELGEFRVVRAHAAHGDEADAFFCVHNLMTSIKGQNAAGNQADHRHGKNQVRLREMRHHHAANRHRDRADDESPRRDDGERAGQRKICAVRQNSRLTAPRPKKEMCPSRYIRRLKLP